MLIGKYRVDIIVEAPITLLRKRVLAFSSNEGQTALLIFPRKGTLFTSQSCLQAVSFRFLKGMGLQKGRFMITSQKYIQSTLGPAKSRTGLHKLGNLVNDFLVEYWAHIIMIVLGSLVLIALAIPFLSYFGLDSMAKPLFFALHYVCAQIPSHSFYLFGHQLGLCARNFSIYASMFLGSLFFVLTKKRMPGIPWWIWVLMLLPIAWDGLTQMIGWRESTWVLRVITGSLFGLGNVWFALPLMHKSLQETLSSPQVPHFVRASRTPRAMNNPPVRYPPTYNREQL